MGKKNQCKSKYKMPKSALIIFGLKQQQMICMMLDLKVICSIFSIKKIKKARNAVKVNGRLSKKNECTKCGNARVRSLKCTTSMDILNQTMLQQEHLTNKYRSAGVLGMVDDNLAIAKCGVNSVIKSAVINLFFFNT